MCFQNDIHIFWRLISILTMQVKLFYIHHKVTLHNEKYMSLKISSPPTSSVSPCNHFYITQSIPSCTCSQLALYESSRKKRVFNGHSRCFNDINGHRSFSFRHYIKIRIIKWVYFYFIHMIICNFLNSLTISFIYFCFAFPRSIFCLLLC